MWTSEGGGSGGAKESDNKDRKGTVASISHVELLADITAQKVPASWGRPETLEKHYDDHAADFGATSWEDYANQANQFLDYAKQNNLPMIEYPNGGEIGAYDPATNTFGIYNADGTTATFYKPTSPNYFNGQIDYVISNAAKGGRVINPLPNNNSPTGSMGLNPLLQHNPLERPGHPELEE